jgi:hypothetical protein
LINQNEGSEIETFHPNKKITFWRSKIFWLSFLITVNLTLVLLSRVERILPGAISMELIAGCEIDFLDTRLQPVFTIALACPGKDFIRLLPLPVIQPWFEDPLLPLG